ncbi:YpbF family protein [Bacillus sp. FJAT-29790]|uniref:YpbF family protein n=1 Tax=Bacillus sp. FJAT-29790 TaxID=1895002 RepID=UPI001C224086|nr:YpbF family protein [Bacillus sp. FJAT-29790]MBU8879142.1 YpbF family protein [Bacillus sp. FJAT-29790]
METSIKMLDEKTDQATRQMLQKVIERKMKFDHMKQRHLLVMWATVLMSFIYFIYIYYTVMKPYSYSFASMFSVYVKQSANLYFLILTVGLYGLMNLLREKKDKAEKEYHALRCEIIDKSKDLWKKEEEWKSRHTVFEMMKVNYDINLYHENK